MEILKSIDFRIQKTDSENCGSLKKGKYLRQNCAENTDPKLYFMRQYITRSSFDVLKNN